MISVPYNLNSYNAYLAVGVDQPSVDTMFFIKIHRAFWPTFLLFERALAGSLVEFTPSGGIGMYAARYGNTGYPHCKPKPCKAYRELPVSQFYPVIWGFEATLQTL